LSQTICSSCSQPTTSYRQRLLASGRWQVTCLVCANPQHSSLAAANPFQELVLDHVLDEMDQPLRVTSLRQLREAEQRYHFRSLVANENSENFDKPPQSDKGDMFKRMSDENRWLYPEIAESMVAEIRESGEL
jgi:hypothetical protein